MGSTEEDWEIYSVLTGRGWDTYLALKEEEWELYSASLEEPWGLYPVLMVLDSEPYAASTEWDWVLSWCSTNQPSSEKHPLPWVV